MVTKEGKVRVPEKVPSKEDIEACAKEVGEILKKYACTLVPRTVITYNRVQQSVDVIPLKINTGDAT